MSRVHPLTNFVISFHGLNLASFICDGKYYQSLPYSWPGAGKHTLLNAPVVNDYISVGLYVYFLLSCIYLLMCVIEGKAKLTKKKIAINLIAMLPAMFMIWPIFVYRMKESDTFYKKLDDHEKEIIEWDSKHSTTNKFYIEKYHRGMF